MQTTDGRLVFSPSDLNHFLECEHLVRLDLARDPSLPRRARDPHADLLAQKGLEHEQAWLDHFRAEGRSVTVIGAAGSGRDWAGEAAATRAAMADGAGVIYQGVFLDGDWRGISDFLVRIERPSALGAWSYEAWDTKLARHARPYFVLQLCFYTEQIARAQGEAPEFMCVVLGTGECDRRRYRDFDAYYRSVRASFRAAITSGRAAEPYPVAHCSLCEYEQRCQDQWYAADHLSQVAGITREQVERLNAAGITTVAGLAALESSPRLGIGSVTLDRLRHQARLQSNYRATGGHSLELLPADERSGFRLLPLPSAGDLFFDIEGDPYFDPARGLEYLFGVMDVDEGRHRFRSFMALDRREEKAAFEAFIDFVHERLRQWPDLHVYHYAAYEPSALKRLMSEHATREDELDDLLRREIFVDLYQVVRQSLRISHDSYSIKKVRTFFMTGAGQGAVTGGGDSILEFERWRRTHDPAILEAIVDYNREDCESTVLLRDWLLQQKAEAESASGTVIPWKAVKLPDEDPKREADDAEAAARRDALEKLGSPAASLLAQLVGYHRREAKPEWWAYFDRKKKSLDELIDDTAAIAYLDPVPGVAPERVLRSLLHTLRFPEQEYKIAPGDPIEDPFHDGSPGTLEWLDGRARQLGLKRGMRREEPLPIALVAAPLDGKMQRQAVGRVADAAIAGQRTYRAIHDLLECAHPRVRGWLAGLSLQTLRLQEQTALDEQQRIVAGLDESYLFIQGPPGSGKTWTGARLIVSLIAAGKRVGVAAMSHKAINNLLAEVEAVALHEKVVFQGLKKCSDDDDRLDGRLIADTMKNEDCESGTAGLVAGTSWLFSRPGMDGQLDYLFIDEAGQIALADAVAMGTAARNLVLLGDPQQLAQVRHGVHPGRSGVSVLEHLLNGAATVSEDRGLFLARSWRMHPDVCGFISELAYDGRLTSAERCAQQRIDSRTLQGTGLRFIPIEHTGNSQQSPEEARAIADAVRDLLDGGTFTDHEGHVRRLTPADILVVAPYNMQVRCLKETLPAGVEAGTVDKFQGREAPVVFFSMASSTADDVRRGLEFLFSRNRFNVAISRAKAMAVLVCSPRLLDARCHTLDQMRLVNNVCAFVERAALKPEA
jgi:predicted RecB family nuclease